MELPAPGLRAEELVARDNDLAACGEQIVKLEGENAALQEKVSQLERRVQELNKDCEDFRQICAANGVDALRNAIIDLAKAGVIAEKNGKFKCNDEEQAQDNPARQQ